jgi:hypothetical protein
LKHQIGPDIFSSHVPVEFRQILLPCRNVVMKPAGSSSPGGLYSLRPRAIPQIAGTNENAAPRRKRRRDFRRKTDLWEVRPNQTHPSAPHFIRSEAAPMECRSAQAHAVPEITRHRITSFRLVDNDKPNVGRFVPSGKRVSFQTNRRAETNKGSRGSPFLVARPWKSVRPSPSCSGGWR